MSTGRLEAVLPAALRPAPGVDLLRVGPVGDGGYQVARDVLAHTEWLVGLGLSDDWRFEARFAELTGVPVSAYDHTVTPRFWARRRAGRIKRAVLRRPGPDLLRRNPASGYRRYRRFFAHPDREHLRLQVGMGSSTMAQILDRYPDRQTFVKMDIEGAEWDTLDALLARQHRIVGAAIEFHDVHVRLGDLLAFVAAADAWTVVHTDVNNVGGIAADGTPRLVELSLARTDLLAAPAGTASGSHSPNSTAAPPIDLRFEAP